MKKYMFKLGLMLVAIIWGSGFIASQIALDEGLTPNQIMAFRFFLSSVLMVSIFNKNLKNINKDTIKAGITIGVFLFIAFAFQTYGLMYTTPSKNAFITAINVVIVPFIGFVVYRRKIDKISIISSIVAILGIGILSLKADFSINIGDFLTFICAIGFAMHIFLTGEHTKKYDPIALTAIQLITAFCLSFILVILTKETNVSLSSKGIASVGYLALFSTTIAFLVQTICQAKTTESEAAIILSTESIFGTLLSALILKEIITFKMIIGCSLIFFAIIMAETKLVFITNKFSNNERIENLE